MAEKPEEGERGAKRPREEVEEPPAVVERPSEEALQQLRAALKKIRGHIGKASKFEKAAALLLKMLEGGSVTQHSNVELFQVSSHLGVREVPAL